MERIITQTNEDSGVEFFFVTLDPHLHTEHIDKRVIRRKL